MSLNRLTIANTSYDPTTVGVVGVVFLSECLRLGRRLVISFLHIDDLYRSTRTEQCPCGAMCLGI